MSIDIMSLIIFLSGMFILAYGLIFAPTDEEEKMLDSSLNMDGLENVIKGLENKLADADKMIAEMDKFSEYVTNEMQEKYKEMMLLYQMIEDKEKKTKKEADEAKLMKIEIEEKKNELKKEQDRKNYDDAKRRQSVSVESFKSFYTPSEKSIAHNQKEKQPVMVAKSSFDDVVYMYENGKDVEDIAKALGKGKGEIRLMLDLMGKEG